MAKLWIGNKLYSVENEVQDYCDKLEGQIEELDQLNLEIADELLGKVKALCKFHKKNFNFMEKKKRIKELEGLLSTVQVQYNRYHSIQQQTLKEIEQALVEGK